VKTRRQQCQKRVASAEGSGDFVFPKPGWLDVIVSDEAINTIRGEQGFLDLLGDPPVFVRVRYEQTETARKPGKSGDLPLPVRHMIDSPPIRPNASTDRGKTAGRWVGRAGLEPATDGL
jgi:hypothetical protein